MECRLCLKYHVKGICYSDCAHKASHCIITGDDKIKSDKYIKTLRGEWLFGQKLSCVLPEFRVPPDKCSENSKIIEFNQDSTFSVNKKDLDEDVVVDHESFKKVILAKPSNISSRKGAENIKSIIKGKLIQSQAKKRTIFLRSP